MAAHLFVRRQKRSSFIYCGDVEWVDWHGDKPITVKWRLPEEVPQRLAADLLELP